MQQELDCRKLYASGWYHHCECRADADFTLDVDSTFKSVDRTLHDVQAETGAIGILCCTIEHLEDLMLMIFWDTLTVVFNFNL